MTDLRRASEMRPHLKQPSFCESFRSSCSSTPELQTFPGTYPLRTFAANGAYGANGAPSANNNYSPTQRLPQGQHSLESNANMGSTTSGGSTTSSTATTATAAIVGARTYNCGAAASGCELQCDEREIYYLSPTKRKGGLRSCERLRSFSPTAATVAPASYPAVAPSAAYGARAAGELSFDKYEVSSHLSDTAMQVLRSGSCSAGSLLRTAASCNSPNSGLAQQHATPAQRVHNNVTFSNFVGEQPPPPPPQSMSTPTPTSSNRGSLRRNKGRSNQSLCSCDAGAETDINPDPTRPLYQYSLERRHKSHTYTCEQNAQILMRLERERERNRKLSLGGNGADDGYDDGDGDREDDGGGAGKDQLQMDSHTSLDLDDIPPVPPPPAMRRNSSLRSLRLLHCQQTGSSSAYRNGDSSSTPAAAANNSHSSGFCPTDELDISSIIDDCTASILKCANAVGAAGADLIAPTGGAHEPSVTATLATMAANTKPDVCHVGSQRQETAFCSTHVCDDIFMPNSKRADPALCFLHVGQHGIGPGHGPELSKSQRDLGGSKYNTIGPSNSYARQLSQYSQHGQQSYHPYADRCRCMSQSQSLSLSLSTSSRDYFGQCQQCGSARSNRTRRDGHTHTHASASSKHIFHTGDEQDWLEGGLPPAVVSRSYSNLVDIDGRQASTRLPYQKFHTPANLFGSSSCSFGNAANLLNSSSFTTLDSSHSGLKDKYHQHPHPHQLRHGDPHAHGHHLHEHAPGVLHHQHPLHPHQDAAASQQQQQKQQQLHSSVTSIMPWKHRQCPSRGSSISGTNSFRFDVAKHWLAVSSILLIIGAASVAVPLALRVAASAPFEERLRVAIQLLDQVPLIDGHNDLPWNIRKFLHNKLSDFNFDEDLRNVMPWARSNWSHTDLTRLKRGRISAQFWAAYVPCEAQHRDAVQVTLEQIDVIKRLTERYSPQLTTCASSEDILEAHKNHQLCSLTGVEGGHSLGGSLAVLRTLYAIGVRYMTLTSTCHTPWADSSYADAPTFNVKHGGLTIFGKVIN